MSYGRENRGSWSVAINAWMNAYELIVRQKGKINCKDGCANICFGMMGMGWSWAGRSLTGFERDFAAHFD